MPFPEDVLTAEERVVLHLRPHWKAAVHPLLVLLLSVVAVVLAWTFLPDNDGGRIGAVVTTGVALVFVLWKVLWPVLVWRSTHYVLTDQRVLLQHGVLARDRRDIPLSRVNDHAMSQRFLERLLGCGTLTVESAGERGQAVLVAVPGVERVQTVLYELVEADRDRHSVGDDELRGIVDAVRDNGEPPGGR